MRSFLVACFLTLLTVGFSEAQSAGGFSRFQVDPNTPRGAFEIIADPTGSAQMKKVYSFTLDPGPCSNRKHVSANSSDCKFRSIRATAYEPDFKRQNDVWTSWNMFLTADFPVGREQKGQGMYTFAYWHNSLCPHVSLVSDTSVGTMLYLQTTRVDPSGKWNCLPDQRIAIADLRDLRGQWQRFELRTVFGDANSGSVELYLNGVKKVERRMSTIAPGPNKTYWVFGVYLCCNQQATEKITPATAYFTRLSRADTRAELR